MKKGIPPFATFLLLLISSLASAQTPLSELLIRKWQCIGIEEFSVINPPDSLSKGDNLVFNKDGTYQWMKKQKRSDGTWKLNETAKTILFTEEDIKKSLSYNLKSLTADELTLEYQSPDLVRTKYKFRAMEK